MDGAGGEVGRWSCAPNGTVRGEEGGGVGEAVDAVYLKKSRRYGR